MRFGRLVAASGVVSIVLAGGLYALAPAIHGEADRSPADCYSADGLAADGEQASVTIKSKSLKGKTGTKAGGLSAWSDDGEDVFELAGADGVLATLDAGGSRIGVSVRDVDPADLARDKLAEPVGAVVDEVRSETPAAKAGVKAGDVVVAFDGERVRSARQLERLVDETPAGRAVKMSVMRSGARVDLDITPESSAQAFGADFASPGGRVGPRFRERTFEHGLTVPAIPPMPRDRVERQFRYRGAPATEFNFDDFPFAMAMGRSRLGVQVEGVEDQLAKYFGVDSGALVRSVADDSPAAKAGVKAGDVITAVNGKPVKDANGLREALQEVEDGKNVTLSVTRDHKPLSLTATLESPQSTRTRVRRVV